MVPVDEGGDEAGEGKHGTDGDNESDVVAGADEWGQSEAIVKEQSVFVIVGDGEGAAVFVRHGEADVGVVANE